MTPEERSQTARALRAAAAVLARGSSQDAFRMFKEAADKIWGDDTEKLVFKLSVEPLKGVLAALRHLRTGKRKMAIGESLMYAPRDFTYTLVLDPKILTQDREVIRRIMIHEAVHIGYPNHDADFRRIVKKHGGALTETDATEQSDKPYKAQKKVGHRYKTVETFESEREAWDFMKAEHAKDRSVKWRLLF